jgi:aspartate-semialdehyde dehydrogenase
MRAHSEAITIETEKPITATAAREILANTPGVRLVDDVARNIYPMPMNATNSFDVEVGRIRDSLVYSPNGLDLFVSGDQLLRGAALNAVLIAEAISKNSK